MRRATASPPVSNPPPVTARSIREHGELGGGGSGLRGCSVGGGGSRPTHDGIREGGRAACRLSARASDAASAGSLPAASGLRATALGDTVRPSESRLICHTWVPLSSPEGCSGRGPISLRARATPTRAPLPGGQPKPSFYMDALTRTHAPRRLWPARSLLPLHLCFSDQPLHPRLLRRAAAVSMCMRGR